MSKIVKCTTSLKQDLLGYLYRDELYNILLIGHLLHYEFDNNHEVFIQYDNEKITACFGRFYTRAFVYSDSMDFNAEELASLINAFKLDRLSGKRCIVELLSPYLKVAKVIYFSYSILSGENALVEDFQDVLVAKVTDIMDILKLIETTQFLTTNYIEINSRKIGNQAGRIYYMEQDKNVVCSAETTAETTNFALIGEVNTSESFRNHGFATKVVSKLAYDLLKEGKCPVLFYNNEKAGNIYHQLGFVDIGEWVMLSLRK